MTVHYIERKGILNNTALCGKRTQSAACVSRFWVHVNCAECLALKAPTVNGARISTKEHQ